MKNQSQLFFLLPLLLVGLAQLNAQEKEGYGFQISEVGIPKRAPTGYTSIKTVQLNKALHRDKAYKVGFWIFGPQLRNRGYSFPIQVFPSNFMEPVDSEIFDLVTSEDIMPSLEVKPPPNYTSKGHYTFVIRPDTIYNYITVALKVRGYEPPPINLSEDIRVTGVFVSALPEEKVDDTKNKSITTAPNTASGKLAERILIDSKKSYSVSEPTLSIGLYDHRNVDKDRITIYLNDEIIVEDLELKKKKRFFKATLKNGINTISLHAENLGDVAPNTAAIIIKNKTQEFMAVLESDLGASQYFTIVYEPN